ncbi:MAG: dihydrodipicolinate synthase family protein [archaeon]|nr:dihydrodipicolinate synthase family protein [archaeon]
MSFVEGIYPAVLTPMHADLAVDVEALKAHCRSLIEQGCAGVVLFGTSGEGPSFTAAEKLAAYAAVASGEQAVAPQKLLLANGAASLLETVEVLRGGLELGCPGFLVCPPSFYKGCAEEGVLEYYRQLIARTRGSSSSSAVAPRVILYHIPQFSGVPITLSVARTLAAEFPGIVVGVKESEGSLPLLKSYIDAIPGFQVFPGNERHLLEALSYVSQTCFSLSLSLSLS